MFKFAKKINMSGSNFWYYLIFAIVLLHVVAGFIYVAIKLSPKKDDKKKQDKDLS